MNYTRLITTERGKLDGTHATERDVQRTSREDECLLRREDETRRGDTSEKHVETACDLVHEQILDRLSSERSVFSTANRWINE